MAAIAIDKQEPITANKPLPSLLCRKRNTDVGEVWRPNSTSSTVSISPTSEYNSRKTLCRYIVLRIVIHSLLLS